MGFELYIDRAVPKWSALGLAIACALEAEHGRRIRYRIRDLAAGNLDDIDPALLPEAIRERGGPPKRDYYWAYNWDCKTCKMPTVPHTQRLLHTTKGHDVTRGPSPTHRAFIPPFKPSCAVVIAQPTRLLAPRAMTVAVTAAPLAAADVHCAYAVALLPLRQYDHEAVKAAILAYRPQTLEQVEIAGAGLEGAVDLIVKFVEGVDRELYAPDDPIAQELADQTLRARSINAVRKGGVPLPALPPALGMKVQQMLSPANVRRAGELMPTAGQGRTRG